MKKIYKVTWCSGAKYLRSLKSAVRLARSKSRAAPGACQGSKVESVRRSKTSPGREMTTGVLLCRQSACRRIG
jgi:hypothetical protein